MIYISYLGRMCFIINTQKCFSLFLLNHWEMLLGKSAMFEITHNKSEKNKIIHFFMK